MNYVTELTDALRDSNIKAADKQAILNSLRDLADKGDAEAKQAVIGLEPPTETTASDSVSTDADGQDPIRSGAIKAQILMGMCDKNQARLGREPFEYDPEVKALCSLWHEAFKRAQAGVPLFKQLFERDLTSHDRRILGLV